MFFFVFARFRDFCFLVVCRCFKFVDFWFYRVFGFLPFSFFLLFGSFAVSVSFGFLLDFGVFPYLGLLVNFHFLLVCWTFCFFAFCIFCWVVAVFAHITNNRNLGCHLSVPSDITWFALDIIAHKRGVPYRREALFLLVSRLRNKLHNIAQKSARSCRSVFPLCRLTSAKENDCRWTFDDKQRFGGRRWPKDVIDRPRMAASATLRLLLLS